MENSKMFRCRLDTYSSFNWRNDHLRKGTEKKPTENETKSRISKEVGFQKLETENCQIQDDFTTKMKANSTRMFHHMSKRRTGKDGVGILGSKIKLNLDIVKNVNGYIKFLITAVLNLGQK